MPRLFWKLFLSFWLALLLFAGGVVLATSLYLDHERERVEASHSSGKIGERTFAARQWVSASGLDGLKEWASKTDRSEIAPVLVLDDDGRDLLGRKPSYRAMKHLQRNLNGEDPRPDDHLVMVQDKRYWVIYDAEGITLGRLVARPGVVGTELVLATLIGGAVCLFLAGYLISPLKRLQTAVRSYGEGKFGIKVTPSLGRRRDEVVDLAVAVDDMGERIQDLLESKRRLLRDVSHELRSPLARIQAAIGLVRQGGEGSNVELGITRIETESSRMNDLISQLLTRARLETDPSRLRRDPLDLRALAGEVAAGALIEAEAKGTRIACDLPEADAAYRGDAALLRSAIDNVLRNAIRHTPDGGEIRVSLRRDGASSGHVVAISDNGTGIPESMLERIFEPFVQVDGWCCRDNQSTGLGLSIAKLAVEAHGGSIAARNRPEGGLQIVMTLPAQADPA